MAVVIDQDIPPEYYELYTQWLTEARDTGAVQLRRPLRYIAYPSPAQVAWREFFRQGTICFAGQDQAARALWYDHAEETWPELWYYNVFMKCWLLGPYNAGLGDCPPIYCVPVKVSSAAHAYFNSWPPDVDDPYVQYYLWKDDEWIFYTSQQCKGYCGWVTLPCPRQEEGLTFEIKVTNVTPLDPDYKFEWFRAWSGSGGTVLDAQTIHFEAVPGASYPYNAFYGELAWLPDPDRYQISCQVFDTTGWPRANCKLEVWRQRYSKYIGWYWYKMFDTTSGPQGFTFYTNGPVSQPDPPIHGQSRSNFQIRGITPPSGYTWHNVWSECGGFKISEQILQVNITEGGLYATNYFELQET